MSKNTKNQDLPKKPEPKLSVFTIIAICGTYTFTASAITVINKKIYALFGKTSPMNILMVQSVINIFVCLSLMTYKEINEQAFESWEAVGIVIPPISKIMKKVNLGLKDRTGQDMTLFQKVSKEKKHVCTEHDLISEDKKSRGFN